MGRQSLRWSWRIHASARAWIQLSRPSTVSSTNSKLIELIDPRRSALFLRPHSSSPLISSTVCSYVWHSNRTAYSLSDPLFLRLCNSRRSISYVYSQIRASSCSHFVGFPSWLINSIQQSILIMKVNSICSLVKFTLQVRGRPINSTVFCNEFLSSLLFRSLFIGLLRHSWKNAWR